MLKSLQFLNSCVSRINGIKQQKLTLPISPAMDSYNGCQFDNDNDDAVKTIESPSLRSGILLITVTERLYILAT